MWKKLPPSAVPKAAAPGLIMGCKYWVQRERAIGARGAKTGRTLPNWKTKLAMEEKLADPEVHKKPSANNDLKYGDLKAELEGLWGVGVCG